MGNNCEHTRTELIETVNEDKNILFTKKTIIVKCLDCLTDGKPTLIRKEINEGNLTGHIYSNNIIDKKECKHDKFTVDDSTYQYHQKDSLFGLLLAMGTARWIHPKTHYIIAIGYCDRCGAGFNVECEYTIEKKWDNYDKKEIQKFGDWTICYKTIGGKSVISYVCGK